MWLGADAEYGDYREMLSSIQRLTGVGVWYYEAGTGEMHWSRKAKEIHGLEPERMLSFSELATHYTESDRSRAMAAFEAAIKECEQFTIDVGLVGEGTTEQSIRMRCDPRVKDGETVSMYGTVRDITDEKRREQRIEVLRKTSQELRKASTRQEVAEIIADAAKNILRLVNTTVRLADRNNSTLRTVEATEECLERAGQRPNYDINEETPAARIYRTGEPEIYSDHEMIEDDHSRGELRSGLYVPIGNHGVLSAGDIVVDAFKEHDLEAAGLLGQLGAEAITRIGWAKRSRAI
ncbi:GAF domain-containing protein [Haloarcula sp. CBA1130]|uniref:GAF domain-containing protein n=1 Tax=unclassified Haloarcula TaxID=2624677 RepID=UPI0012455D6E|nr:GAF domain-containing protein [Haloarcula sp. CBA1130]KAA9400015.1 GAF domain-containing protein [Haloarcula sp. CBA1129]